MKKTAAILFFFLIVTPITSMAEKAAIQDPDALIEEKIIYLEQNWSEKDRQYFYFTDQGSRYMPYDIYINLEQSENERLFNDPENNGSVTKASLLGRDTLDPSFKRHKYSFFPLDHAFLLCEKHNSLTANINFQDNLLNELLSRD